MDFSNITMDLLNNTLDFSNNTVSDDEILQMDPTLRNILFGCSALLMVIAIMVCLACFEKCGNEAKDERRIESGRPLVTKAEA